MPMILHIDMDAFYTSVEARERPELVGRPLVVGGTPQGRGVVAAASYEARKYGIHSAMPAATARRLCPAAVFLPARHDYYGEVSRQIRAIFERYTPLVEPLALDEAFLDVRESEALFGPSPTIGRRIKREIAAELQLTASVGVAPNKFLAKIASDLDKPDGFVVVDALRVHEFLDPLPVRRLWGVGEVAAAQLQRLGVDTIGGLRRLPASRLKRLFGRNGEHMWELAHGIDDRAVVPDQQAKSISHETTFGADITDRETLRACLLELTEQVCRRLRRYQLRGRTVQVKIRYADFSTITRARTLAAATHSTREVWHVAAVLLERNLPARHQGVRLLGIGVTGFERAQPLQATLFEEDVREKHGRLDTLSDTVKERFGAAAMRRGAELKRER